MPATRYNIGSNTTKSIGINSRTALDLLQPVNVFVIVWPITVKKKIELWEKSFFFFLKKSRLWDRQEFP